MEVFPAAEEADRLDYLGPDLLGPDWDADEAVRRLAAAPDVPIAVALGEQRNLAGLGNVYVNELCFLRGIRPTRPAGEVDLPPLVDLASRVMRANRDRIARIDDRQRPPRRAALGLLARRRAVPPLRHAHRARPARPQRTRAARHLVVPELPALSDAPAATVGLS